MSGTKPKWDSEAAMLVAFAGLAAKMGFRCVPEACGHDLLLVAGPNLRSVDYSHPPACIEPGDVVAVEGKLRASITVLRQALPPFRRRLLGNERESAADFYCVCIPEHDTDFAEVAMALDIGVAIMTPSGTRGWRGDRLERWDIQHAARVLGHPALAVPALDVEIVPGRPAPRALTPWKIAAVRLCLLGAQRDLGTADFVDTPVRARTFLDRGWMEPASGRGKSSTFRLLDAEERPDRAYPEIAAAYARDQLSKAQR